MAFQWHLNGKFLAFQWNFKNSFLNKLRLLRNGCSFGRIMAFEWHLNGTPMANQWKMTEILHF
ncbi:hypothetical protein NIES4070_72820 (plasmid) [Nostoc commune HK-02]|uniref:hypothetical protein n=1 Tax=Nostoc commune TaxID=1178 RepID=UPI000D5A0167|nr:hypothetical protein [Nostoc commune]BBD70871.1 hypothetical protein NIES4070_72820 [Nostoc commune HK-02]